MKTAIGIGSAYYNGEDWDQLVDYTVEADRIWLITFGQRRPGVWMR